MTLHLKIKLLTFMHLCISIHTKENLLQSGRYSENWPSITNTCFLKQNFIQMCEQSSFHEKNPFLYTKTDIHITQSTFGEPHEFSPKNVRHVHKLRPCYKNKSKIDELMPTVRPNTVFPNQDCQKKKFEQMVRKVPTEGKNRI